MEKRGGNFTAAKRARISVHSGDSFAFDDTRDFHFLTLLSEEIQDDQVNVITEGLQLQKALASSLMVCDSDDDDGGEGEMIREGKLVPESELRVDDSAGGVGIWLFDSDDTEEEENSAGKSAVGTAILSDDSGENSAAESSAEIGLIPDHSAAEEKTRSFLKKSVLTTDSGATVAAKSSPETALIPDLPAAEEEENWSFVEISQLASSIITDLKDSAATSSPETAIIPDHSVAAEDDENWSFVEKSGLKSMKITDTGSTGTVKNSAAPKSWPRKSATGTPEDDFANWAFMNDSCELCTTEDTLRRLIRVPGCGHYFCHYCFEWYTSSELGSEKCLIKCPAETCFNQIDSDHCVALKLQNTLDRRDESISDWEFLDDSQNLLP